MLALLQGGLEVFLSNRPPFHLPPPKLTLHQEVTFPIRASLGVSSLDQLKRLLVAGHSLTLWGDVTQADLDILQREIPAER